MSIQEIQLKNKKWSYDPSNVIGKPGGFGVVFQGQDSDGQAVAIKRLNIDAHAAAHRELTIAAALQGRNLQHVIAVYDFGLDPASNRYFIVMELAEKSLEAHLTSVKSLTDKEATNIALQIARGLAEVFDIVHRDLKPDNVLLLNGKWKIADFGIAKFVEDSTSQNTMRNCLTPAYAAPEQWKGETATNATDVYALGCTLYRLLTGQPPFVAAAPSEIARMHVEMAPKELAAGPPALRALVSQMLRKSQEVRPLTQTVIKRLENIANDKAEERPQIGRSKLQQQGAILSARQAEEEAARIARERARDLLERLEREGWGILIETRERLFQHIVDTIPGAALQNVDRVNMENGVHLTIKIMQGHDFHRSDLTKLGLDIVAAAYMGVEQRLPKPYIWGANLFFSRLDNKHPYRWVEMAFYEWQPRRHQPFFIQNSGELLEALGPGMHVINLAYGQLGINDEDEEAFTDRWCCLVAYALEGKLGMPRMLPIQGDRFWENLTML